MLQKPSTKAQAKDLSEQYCCWYLVPVNHQREFFKGCLNHQPSEGLPRYKVVTPLKYLTCIILLIPAISGLIPAISGHHQGFASTFSKESPRAQLAAHHPCVASSHTVQFAALFLKPPLFCWWLPIHGPYVFFHMIGLGGHNFFLCFLDLRKLDAWKKGKKILSQLVMEKWR